jgi:hypothetical protein
VDRLRKNRAAENVRRRADRVDAAIIEVLSSHSAEIRASPVVSGVLKI